MAIVREEALKKYVQHKPECLKLHCSRCGAVRVKHLTWGHDWQDQNCTCGLQVLLDGSDLPSPEWQDISTAPKDGTNFLAASSASSVFFAHWANGVVDSSSWTDEGGYEGRYATHWMPLPTPPSSACVLPQIREET